VKTFDIFVFIIFLIQAPGCVVTIDKRVRLSFPLQYILLAFFFIIITFIRHSRDFSVAFWSILHVFSLLFWQPLNAWHSHQCHVNKSLIRNTHYIIFFAFIEKLYVVSPWKSTHRSSRCVSHTNWDKSARTFKRLIHIFLLAFLFSSVARVQFTPLWQTNKQSFPSLFCQLCSRMRVAGFVLFSRRREFLYYENISCWRKWIISFLSRKLDLCPGELT